MISSSEMRKLEDLSQQKGISKLQLMETAGKGIYEILKNKFELNDKKILILAYHGNNGGDGFTAARYLSQQSFVDVLFIGEERKLKEEALTNYIKMLNNRKIHLLRTDDKVNFDDYDVIIDSLLGIGIQGDIKEPMAKYIRLFNLAKGFKVSIDIPTGINPDTGQKANEFAKPDLIITFHDLKIGLKDYKDKTVIVDIGIKD